MTNYIAQPIVESAIRRGIKAVGVGKKGSRSLSAELAYEILTELKAGKVKPAEKGAFFAGLVCKGLTEEEKILTQYFPAEVFDKPIELAKILASDAPKDIQEICGQLLAQQELDTARAYHLGQFLMSNQPGDGARGVAASALRVRYETADEYDGLLKSIRETVSVEFATPIPTGKPVIQLAEPFDGVDHNYMLTPCLAEFLQNLNFRVVTLIGRNSGPKFFNNLYDIAKHLNLMFLKNNLTFSNVKHEGGYYIDQKDLSAALDQWVDLRHTIIKRPFLATLEKFLNPCQADILITSAFHGVYGEKMIEIAQRAQFPASIVVRNGVEGSLAFPLTRPAKLLCCARKHDGSYNRTEMTLDAQELIGVSITSEEKLEHPSLDINCQLIANHLKYQETQNPEFDNRVRATCLGIQKAVDWIQSTRSLI